MHTLLYTASACLGAQTIVSVQDRKLSASTHEAGACCNADLACLAALAEMHFLKGTPFLVCVS